MFNYCFSYNTRCPLSRATNQQNFSEVRSRAKQDQIDFLLRYTIDQETSVERILLTQGIRVLDPYYSLTKGSTHCIRERSRRPTPSKETMLNDLETEN
jgi:hypothetical protein